MSRVYVSTQGGRRARQQEAEEEWGKTTSQSTFRGYEPTEMASVRDVPLYQKNAMSSFLGQRGGHATNSSHAEDLRDYARSVSVSRARSSASGSRPPRPTWASTHERPIRHQPFLAQTQLQRDQQAAAAARSRHFPGRDETTSLDSKRLLMELALNRCSRDSVASASTMETQSAFTISSSGASRLTGARSQMSRSAVSVPSLCSAISSQGRTRRGYEAPFRSPALSEAGSSMLG